jgi:hypothetical protein
LRKVYKADYRFNHVINMNQINTKRLILDEKALAEMGLTANELWILEYDMPSELDVTEGQKKAIKKMSVEERKAIEKKSKLAREFRNKLLFALKFKLRATKHLDSSWLLDNTQLEATISEMEDLKRDMKQKGFDDIDNRIRIIPIITTSEGVQNYEDKKAEFVLQFLMEHVKYAEKGIEQKRISQSTLWRCKQAVSICNALAEELKDNQHYNEIIDTVNMLDELVANADSFILKDKKKEDKEKDE